MKKVFLVFGFFLVGCDVEPGRDNSGALFALSETLTITVGMPTIDEGVRQTSPGGFILSFPMFAVTALGDTVINQFFSEGFNDGNSVTEARSRIVEKMQTAIDEYQARHTLYNSAAFQNTPAVIQAALNGGA